MRFVRGLLTRGPAVRRGQTFRVAGGEALPAAEVEALAGLGVLVVDAAGCRCAAGARTWLRRQVLRAGSDSLPQESTDGARPVTAASLGLAESPLARLAAANGAEPPFLAPHQVEAGERVRRLVERARLTARVTMSYDPARTPGSRGAAGDISDMAADARRRLASLMRALPRDCADVVLDVCGLEKGLQAIEAERGWPRRSAKLVLRIGLDQLARHFGLDAEASGRERGPLRGWMEADARPPMFIDE
jgi:hypothetical protein